MVVSKPNRKKIEPAVESADAFISKGGSSAVEGNGHKAPGEVRMTFRCPKALIDRIDKVREETPGHLSRNQAIVNVLSEHLPKLTD